MNYVDFYSVVSSDIVGPESVRANLCLYSLHTSDDSLFAR